jgi:hypothetical protein
MKRETKTISYQKTRLIKEKSDCEGCEDNFYNGNNPHGTKECWKFNDAKIIMRKRVHINQVPPWNQEPELILKKWV